MTSGVTSMGDIYMEKEANSFWWCEDVTEYVV